MVQKAEKGDIHLDDCVTSAGRMSRKMPGSRVVFVQSHAYIIPKGARSRDVAINVPLSLHIAGVEFPVRFPFASFTVGELKKHVRAGDAADITHLLHRPQRRQRRG